MVNIDLLLQVRDAILEEPRKFNMDTWFSSSTEAPCGTTACIGGWATIIDAKLTDKERRALTNLDDGDATVLPPVIPDHSEARARLGLTPTQARRLFYVEEWPPAFRKAYETADLAVSSLRGRLFEEGAGKAKLKAAMYGAKFVISRLAAARIDYFIATGK